MTNAELAILSLVAEAPRHGYEIERVIEARGMRDWTDVGFSSIYYVLKRLEQHGWIQSRAEAVVGQGAARKVYSLTEEGEREFEAAVIRALSEPERDTAYFQVGLACIDRVPKTAALKALQDHVEALEQRAEYVRTRRDQQRPLPVNVSAMFDLSLAMIETQRVWIRDFIEKWEQNNGQG